jgi:methylmalonyl-CoA/ethylmalonyl-CoA epimerase
LLFLTSSTACAISFLPEGGQDMIRQISHLGIAVEDLEESMNFYRTVLGLDPSAPITGGNGSIKASMIKVGEVHLELLQPLGREGVMAKFLEKRGEGFHHICYEVDNLHKAIASIKDGGVEVLGEPMDGVEGLSIFLHPRDTHGVLTELVQRDKKEKPQNKE